MCFVNSKEWNEYLLLNLIFVFQWLLLGCESLYRYSVVFIIGLQTILSSNQWRVFEVTLSNFDVNFLNFKLVYLSQILLDLLTENHFIFHQHRQEVAFEMMLEWIKWETNKATFQVEKEKWILKLLWRNYDVKNH